jgi:hypothetical protein
MKSALAIAAGIAVFLVSTSAEAQHTCRGYSTCESGLSTCTARKAAGMTSAPNCEAAAAECRKTGVWRGVSERGPFECRIPGR